jgi:RTX calcium-binding nonapeptide repeat (4 copies)
VRLRLVVGGLAVAALLAGAEASAETRVGTPRADKLRGTAASDILVGRAGNDRLNGRGGNDLLSGGAGRDAIVCGPGLDAVIADRADTIDSTCELVASRNAVRSSSPQPAQPTPSTEEAETSTDEGSTVDSTTDTKDEIVLGWLFPAEGDPDWTTGIVYFLLGMAGALVTTYLFLGEFLPSMGGKAQYEADEWDLKNKKESRDKLGEERGLLARETPVNESKLRALESMSKDLSAEIDEAQRVHRSERWRLTALAIPVYVVLGGAFATAFATTLPQALLIGFGWVAVADRLGLKRETDARDDLRGKEIEKLEQDANQSTEEAVKLRDERQRLEGGLTEAAKQLEHLQQELEESRTRAAKAEAEVGTYKEASEQMAHQVEELRGASTASEQ